MAELRLEDRRTAIAMTTLTRAAAVAHAGDHQHARELCATAMFDVLAIVARRHELLQLLVHALLVSHGLRQLSRLAQALAGLHLRFLFRLDGGPQGDAPRREENGRDVIYTIDPRWLTRLKADDPFVVSLSDALSARRGSAARSVAPEPIRVESA